jgi:hypothetical protein
MVGRAFGARGSLNDLNLNLDVNLSKCLKHLKPPKGGAALRRLHDRRAEDARAADGHAGGCWRDRCGVTNRRDGCSALSRLPTDS